MNRWQTKAFDRVVWNVTQHEKNGIAENILDELQLER